MEFPVITFPWFGAGTLIAVIAIVHVVINHAVAIGGSVLMVWTEAKAHRTNNPELERTARTMSKWILIVTTTVGAMTGVGIWFSTTVIQPYAIGSLLRIFHWAWFAEWIVFISEVVLILIYFYTWDRWKGEKKKLHIRTGIALVAASWLTMTIITAILACQMTPGKWVATLSFWDAFVNPTWLPSLFFRTFVALTLGVGLFAPFIRLGVKNKANAAGLLRDFGKIVLLCFPFLIVGAIWYSCNLPSEASNLIVWASGMQNEFFVLVNVTVLILIAVIGIGLYKAPSRVPVALSVTVAFLSVGIIGEFEMIRETIRKPFVIYDYMYVNGIRTDQVDTFQRNGFLKTAKWTTVHDVTPDNERTAGRELFAAQCMTCHTVDGWRSKRAMNQRMQGWTAENIANYVKNLHQARSFMPPFAGNEEELQALGKYLEAVGQGRETSEQVAERGTAHE
ncbi:c-type cytochrome [Tumebacillus flagellatus]|uniref:Cytochrome C n=1 Tax=Tumebacillus flagellatus TaxID=1157490 RepID=A0A074MA63_9BACL|nr:c-type cytochrome [Tumebacillus flagellatus]KEO82847.1 cytochrome C [Tumebacillus flagellatus]